jgi:peptidoglycan/LPS O-acetylase OafA/YrhL
MPDLRRSLVSWIGVGSYGVMVFFLVSGYIIPASLERKGSVRSFWISRMFRMYPLWAVAGAVTLLLALTGVAPLRSELARQSVPSAVVGHGTLLQDLLGTPNMINVLWTLGYEVAFYLLVVGLFSVGLHRRSASFALGFAGVSVVLGGVLPTALLSRTAGIDATVFLTAAVLVAAIGCAMSGRPVLRTAGAIAGALLALVLVAVNGRVGPWEGLMILAVMFTGTVVYRAEHKQIPQGLAVVTVVAVFGCALASGAWHGYDAGGWCTAIAATAVTFGAGFALRKRHIPVWAATLGLISYSVYLLHPVLLMVTDGTIGRPQQDRVEAEVAFLAVLLLLCRLTHRFVEAPAQRWGRTLARRMDD